MNIRICFMFIVLAVSTLFAKPLQATTKDLYLYLLKIQIPYGITLQEPFCGFYKGKSLDFDKNWTIVPEEEKSLAFSLVITPEVGFTTQGNNVRYMKRIEEQPFCWYDITLKFKTEPKKTKSDDEDDEPEEPVSSYVWEIKKLTAEEAPVQIPDHAIIILLPPKFISAVTENNCLKCINKAMDLHASKIIALPSIVICKDVKEDELNEACVHAQLASFELRTVHQKPIMDIRKEQLAIIALCNQ